MGSSMLQKTKISLTSQLDEVKQFDDVIQQKDESMRILQKVEYDVNNWRNKYENEAVSKIEELEAGKLKLQARLSESESTLGNLNNKLVSIEKHKHYVEKDIEDARYKLDQAMSNHG